MGRSSEINGNEESKEKEEMKNRCSSFIPTKTTTVYMLE